MMYCYECGKEVLDEAVICPGCGCIIKKVGMKSSMPAAETGKGKQVSLILGILGIVFAWLFALVGHIVSIIGIVYGSKEYKETEKITGLILSVIGEICSIISSLIGIMIVSGL